MSEGGSFAGRVATVIQSWGYTVEHQVGPDGYRIDIAVSHPERNCQIATILLDGENYHSIASDVDRDCLLKSVLEGQVWAKVHQIWIEKWYFDEAGETERLRDVLEQAFELTRDGPVIVGANG